MVAFTKAQNRLTPIEPKLSMAQYENQPVPVKPQMLSGPSIIDRTS
jgi:hypothetical protein